MNAENFLTRAFIFIESENWDMADEYIEKVLDLSPQNPNAYLGKLMIELRIKDADGFKNITQPFDENLNYKFFLKFGSESETAPIRKLAEQIRVNHDKACTENTYELAVNTMETARSSKKFEIAADLFAQVIDYKDSADMIKLCIQKSANLKKRTKKVIMLTSIFVSILLILFASGRFYQKVIFPQKTYNNNLNTYNNALNLMKNKKYSEAITEFKKITKFKDSESKITECQNYHKFYTIPDVDDDGSPGNIIENYSLERGGVRLPFISEFTHNNILYTIYADSVGINIVSPVIKYKKTLSNYTCPNVYGKKLYCYNKKTNKIVSFDIKAILCDIEQETILYDIKLENPLLSYSFIFVNKDKILIRNLDTITLIDLNGNKINTFTDTGITEACMTSEKSLAYISEDNVITVLNFETLEKKNINISDTSQKLDRICAYSDGKYYLSSETTKFFIYDENKATTIEYDGSIISTYKNFLVGAYAPEDYVPPKTKGFHIANYPCGSINMKNNKKYRLPLKHISAVNFGKNNKMYVCGYNGGYSDDWTIYRMDLDGKNAEKIGVYKH